MLMALTSTPIIFIPKSAQIPFHQLQDTSSKPFVRPLLVKPHQFEDGLLISMIDLVVNGFK
jgi:hypothetical protein